MYLEERHTISQPGVLSNKIQMASYSIRHDVSALNPISRYATDSFARINSECTTFES